MSIHDVSPASVLHAIRAGKNTRLLLAEQFEVLPIPHGKLDAVIAELTSGKPARLIEHDNGVLHVNDLFEQLPHDPEEG